MNGETTVTAASQINVILIAVLSGCAMGLYYDFFRIIRKIFPCGKTSVLIQDIFFWSTSAIVIFYENIILNSGYVRVSFTAVILLSWILYFHSVGKIIMFIVNIAITLIKRLFSIIYRRIISPSGKLIDHFFMLISQKITRILTHMTKNKKLDKKC